MENSGNQLRFRKALAAVLVVGLVIHVALLLFFTFSNSSNPLGKSLPAEIYQHHFHLGPFFTETTIRSTDQFVIGLSREGSWNYANVSRNYFGRYLDQPWRSYELTIRNFIRSEGVNLTRSKDPQRSLAFRRLLHVMKEEMPEAATSDSVRWLIVRRKYNTASRIHEPDTVFRLTFAPGDAQ